jgi:hypothetical protein
MLGAQCTIRVFCTNQAEYLDGEITLLQNHGGCCDR